MTYGLVGRCTLYVTAAMVDIWIRKTEGQRRDFSYKVMLGKRRVSVWKGFLEKVILKLSCKR